MPRPSGRRQTGSGGRQACILALGMLAAILLLGFAAPPSSGEKRVVLEGESLKVRTPHGKIYENPAASGARAMMMFTRSPGRASFKLETPSLVSVRASGNSCMGRTHLLVKVDSRRVILSKILSGGWRDYRSQVTLPAGQHNISVSMLRDATTAGCSRTLRVDMIQFTAIKREVPPPEMSSPGAPPQPLPDDQGTPDQNQGSPMGVNLAGAEFGSNMPGVYGRDYTYPSAEEISYYVSKNVGVIRVPFKWERVQRTLGGPLDPAELARLDTVVANARENGVRVILDCHNYGRYESKEAGGVIGSSSVQAEDFADLWRRLAEHYSTEESIYAYGLMNEPHDMGGPNVWLGAAQDAVDAIREEDRDTPIMVAGDGWSTSKFWRDNNEDLDIDDPSKLVIYEAHVYFENEHTGNYNESYEDEGAYPTIGVDRLRPFVEWLNENGHRGFIGEFGVPDTDPRWLEVLDTTLIYMEQNDLGGTYWAGGPWWGDYPLSIEPRRDGADRPQMDVLEKHLKPPPAT